MLKADLHKGQVEEIPYVFLCISDIFKLCPSGAMDSASDFGSEG